MTTTLNSFVSETQLTASEATLISTGTGETKFIGAATVTNTHTANVTVTFWRIGSAVTGTTGSGGNQFIVKSLGAGSTERLDKLLGQVLGNSMKLSGLASVAGVVNVDISGTTET